jgi:hypothetical protein
MKMDVRLAISDMRLTTHDSPFTIHSSRFHHLTISLFFFLFITSAHSQSLHNQNFVYKPTIRTVQLYKTGFELSAPIIQLNSGETLNLEFDDLDPEMGRFKFTVVHCTADWQTTPDLPYTDYISGFREDEIRQYDYSANTLVKYTHFTAQIPSRDLQLKLSGNYLLIVYDGDPDNVVLTRRFMVTEYTPVTVEGKVIQATKTGDYLTRQQVDFLVNLHGFSVMDVPREVKVVVQQNGRWDNALRLGKPRFVRGNELDYRYDENIAFNGGNLFRSFDTKSLQYQSERIARIVSDTTYFVTLLDDLPRPFKQMNNGTDLNGRYYIKSEDHAENSTLEAEYAWVSFFVPWPALMSTGKVHLLGELTDWNLDTKSQMNYNFTRKGYELRLLLKQGYYDYIYVVKENGKSTGEESYIEGNHWEARNDYTIYVYYQQTGAGYDRLISTGFLESLKP